MESPLVDPEIELVAPEPRLELLPPLDEPEAEAEQAEVEDEDEPEAAQKAEATQDPLKLYVRAIGDGRRSASSRAARTRATRPPSGA
jgi:hypothetical protein